MDFNSYLAENWMHIGHYDTKTIQINRKQLLMNKICLIILLISTLKYLIILLDFSSDNRLRFYLINYYLFTESTQKIIDLGCFLVLVNSSFDYYYWPNVLDKDLKLLKNLDFLFNFNVDELIRNFNLDRKSTEKLVKKAKLYTSSNEAIYVCN